MVESNRRQRLGYVCALTLALSCGASQATDPTPAALSAIAAFDDWSAAHRDQLSASDIDQGLSLARARRQSMQLLIATDPQAALEHAVTFSVRARMPAAIAAQLETRIDGMGQLTDMVQMYHDHAPAADLPADQFHRSVRYPVVVFGDARYFNFSYGRRLGIHSLKLVPVHGVAIDGDMALSEHPYRILDAGEPVANAHGGERAASCDTAAAAVAGTSRQLLVGDTVYTVCADSDIDRIEQAWALAERAGADGQVLRPDSETQSTWTTGPKTFLYFRTRFSDQDAALLPNDATAAATMAGLRDYMRAFSYQALPDVIATITPILVLPQTEAYYVTNGDLILLQHARAAATTAGFNPSNYSFYSMRFRGGPGGYAGQAYVGATGMWLKSDDGGVAAHELGHNLGLYHANAWTAAGIDPVGAGANAEYGNDYDRMGSGSGVKAHYCASFKDQLTWLLDPQFARLWGSGTYRIYSHDVAQPPSDLGSAAFYPREKLWMADAAATTPQRGLYWFEHRNQYTEFSGAVHVNLQGTANYFLDLTPMSRNGDRDGGLVLGHTYSDPHLGLNVTPIQKNATSPPSFDLAVNIGAFAGNGGPTVALGASATTVAVNAPVTLTATASDPDGDALAYSWEWGDGTFGSVNAAGTSKSWAATGHYPVRVVASDMKGGVAADTIVITVGAPTTFRASGRVSVGGIGVEGVHVWNGQAGANYRGAYTDSDGTYTVAGLAAGALTVSAGKAGYTMVSAFTNPVAISADTANLDFNATLMPVVSIVATDAAGSPITADPIVFRISRNGPTTAALRVWFDRQGTAFSSGTTGDYAISTTTNRFVDLPIGAANIDLTVTPVVDTVADEPNETVIIDLVDGIDYQVSFPGRALGTISGLAGPPNDNFANRITLAGAATSTTGQNRNATLEYMEPAHNGRSATSNSVWWTWTAPANGSVVVNLAGSSFDTLLAIYTGTALDQLMPLSANNNIGTVLQSRLSFRAVAGTTYQIAVASPASSSAGGDIALSIALDLNSVFANGFE